MKCAAGRPTRRGEVNTNKWGHHEEVRIFTGTVSRELSVTMWLGKDGLVARINKWLIFPLKKFVTTYWIYFRKNVCFLKITKNQFIFCLFQVWALKYHGLKIMSCSRQILFKIILICSVCLCAGCCVEVREQRDEHPAVQLQPPPLLATQLHGRLYLVSAFCWRKRWAHFYYEFFF